MSLVIPDFAPNITMTDYHEIRYTHIHVPLRMKSNNFGDPLTFHSAPSSGENVNLSNT